MLALNDDNILHITTFINFEDILNLSAISKFFYKIYDEEFYKAFFIKYFNNLFNEEFYTSLSIRFFSNTLLKLDKVRLFNSALYLKNYKQKMIRLEHLQKYATTLNLDQWHPKDFYNYWLYKNYVYY